MGPGSDSQPGALLPRRFLIVLGDWRLEGVGNGLTGIIRFLKSGVLPTDLVEMTQGPTPILNKSPIHRHSAIRNGNPQSPIRNPQSFAS
jgi:hypothetical protein